MKIIKIQKLHELLNDKILTFLKLLLLILIDLKLIKLIKLIIFFRSHSYRALIFDIIIVKIETNNR